MKISIEYGYITINIIDNFFIELKSDWFQLFGKYNWYSFNLIKIYFENDKMTGGIEFEFWLLGFGIRIRYNYDDTLEKMAKNVKKMV